MIAIPIVLGALFYLFVTGLVFTRVIEAIECNYNCYHDHDITAFIAGIFWPAALPFIAGRIMPTKSERLEDRREREREQAEHGLNLEKLRTARLKELEKEVGLL